jgi:hypothetical protein
MGPSFTASAGAAQPVGMSGRPMDGLPSAINGIGASNDASIEPSYVSATESSASGNGFSGNGAYSNGSSMNEARSGSASLEAETRRIVDSPGSNTSSASSSNEIKTNGYEASTGLASSTASVEAGSLAPSGARPEPPSAAYAPNEPALPGKKGTSFPPSEPAPATAAPNQGEQRPDMAAAPPSAASIAAESGARPAANTAGKSTDALLEPPSAAYTSNTLPMGGPGVSEAKFSGTDATFTNGSNRESLSDRDDAEAASLEEKKPNGIFGRLFDSVLGRQPEKETVRETIRETVVREKGEMVGSAAPRGTNAPIPTDAPETDAQMPAPYDPNSAQAFAQPSSPMPSSSDPEQRKTIFDDDRLRKRDENEKRGES